MQSANPLRRLLKIYIAKIKKITPIPLAIRPSYTT
jgi:hypothetical protein